MDFPITLFVFRRENASDTHTALTTVMATTAIVDQCHTGDTDTTDAVTFFSISPYFQFSGILKQIVMLLIAGGNGYLAGVLTGMMLTGK